MGAVTTTVACGAAGHEIRWAEGRLELCDHADVAAEQTLGALGGAVPACLGLRRAWEKHATDPVLVTLGRRPGEADLGFGGAALAGGGVDDDGPARRREDLLRLFCLPAPFIDRLVLGAWAAAAESWSEPAFRDRHGLRFGAALASRAAPALGRLGAELARPGEQVVVHCTPAVTAGDLSIRAERTARGIEVTASLPLAWLSRVWGPGLSEPANLVVVSRRQRRGDIYDVDAAAWVAAGEGRWEVRPRRVRLVRGGDGSWLVTG